MKVNLPKNRSVVAAQDARMMYASATMASTRSKTAGTNIQFALPRMFDPARNGMTGTQNRSYGSGYDLLKFDEEQEARKNILLACRNIMKTHPIMHACCEVYSRYPVQGIDVSHEDAEYERFYRELFLEDLDFKNFLINLGKVYWTDGTAIAWGNWSDSLKLWVGEDILDPLTVDIQRIPFVNEDMVYMIPQDDLKEMARGQTLQGREFRRRFPDMANRISTGENILLSNDRVTILANKDRPSDLWGTPVMLRCWNTLMLEDRMNAAMRATAERLYAPLIMFTIGGQLPNGQTFIPSAGMLDAFRNNLDAALASDFRAIITHDGVKAQEVIRGDRMNNFKQDVDMYDDRIMMAWGLSPALLKPSAGNYATSALEFQLAAQMLSSYQSTLISLYNKQAAMVAEANGHYEYEKKGDSIKTVYEKKEVWDPDYENEDGSAGAYVVKEVPKLSWPKLTFDVINFKNEQEERKFRMELRNAGVPIADEDLAIGVDINLKDSSAKFQDEQIEKSVNEAKRENAIFEATMKQGYVVPPDTKKYMESGIAPITLTKIVERYRNNDTRGNGYGDDYRSDDERPFDTGDIGNSSDIGQRPEISDEQRGGHTAV